MVNESTKDDKNQFDRFKKAAREHECDEDEAVFDGKLKKISKSHEKPDRK